VEGAVSLLRRKRQFSRSALANSLLTPLEKMWRSPFGIGTYTIQPKAKERHMNYSTSLLCTLLPLFLEPSAKVQQPTLTASLAQTFADIFHNVLQAVTEHGQQFLSHPVDPERTFQFEHQLNDLLRETGRQVVQAVYHHVEPAVESLPKHVAFETSHYTRLNHKTPQNVWTLFGQLRLERVAYRPTDKTGEPCIFPVSQALGLMHGASPALAERAAGLMSDTGMTQQTVLKRLQQDHGVGWGVKKLRQVTEFLSAEMAEQRHEVQVEKLVQLLQQATIARGKHKPVLSVGRDGITLGLRIAAGSVREVASCGTVTVMDRRGKRLGTVYLAYVPEFGQGTMSKQLTRLVTEVLKRWEGPLPRLSYVTDSGDNETTYYDKVLARMTHPRTGENLAWLRVVDYYHASERLWSMAKLLFGEGQRATSWVRKMQKWLLKPSGVYRVLHSAAALREQQKLCGKKLGEFRKAYRYIRDRMKYMKYAEYRKVGIPLGSGVTEAGCKTVYTQRLKLSGMLWKKAGAEKILNLRVLRVSGVWDQAYQRLLRGIKQPQVRDQAEKAEKEAQKAA
jgi:hypothetical protein